MDETHDFFLNSLTASDAVTKLQWSESTAASDEQSAATSFDLTHRLDQPGEHCPSPSPLHWS